MGDRVTTLKRAKWVAIGIAIAVAGSAIAAGVWNIFSPGTTPNAVTYNNAGSYTLGNVINTTSTNEFLTQSSSGIPAFNTIQSTDVPAINLAASGSGGVTGDLPVGNLGGGTGASSTTFWRGDGTWATPAYATGANPTASVGLTAVNGTATTFMRSDAAPALSQSISPTMTGSWTFSSNPLILSSGGSATAPGAWVFNGDTNTGFFQNGLNNISIASDGVLIVTISPSTFTLSGTTNLTVNGLMSVPGMGASTSAQTGYVCFGTGGLLTYDTTNTCLISSAAYKEDMRPLRGALKEAMRLRPISFRYKPQYNPGHLGTQIGFTAESVARIDPRLAAFNPKTGKPRSVQYDHISVLAIAAIQAEQREIVQLRRRVRTLSRSCAH